MAYCTNCGSKLNNNAKFCSECGCSLNDKNSKREEGEKRKVYYEGDIYKCPNCGETLDSFVGKCPSCGYEIRGKRNSEAIDNFIRKINNTYSESQKIDIIKNFVVPNTKEDILQFIILAKSNILKEDLNQDGFLSEEEKKLSNAWFTLAEQCYSKAKIIFYDNDETLRTFENEYNQIVKRKIKKNIINQYALNKLNFKNSVVVLVTMLAGTLFTVIQMIFAFVWLNPLMIVFSIIQLLLLIIALLNGLEILKFGFKGIYYLFIFSCLILSLFNVVSCDGDKIIWEDYILTEKLPNPTLKRGYIKTDTFEDLIVQLYCEEEAFVDYVNLCQENGYIIETQKTSKSFTAFNVDGYKVTLTYTGKKMNIHLVAPMTMSEILWPNNKLVSSLPKPSTTIGKIEINNGQIFSIYLKDFTYEMYKSYIKNVYDNGFNMYHENTDKTFTARNQDGYIATINYVGFNVIYIKLEEMIDIKIEFDYYDLKNNDYTMVLEMLEKAGFTNIELKPRKIVYENLYVDGEVDYISINGDKYFSEGDVFRHDVKIIISYYSSKIE